MVLRLSSAGGNSGCSFSQVALFGWLYGSCGICSKEMDEDCESGLPMLTVRNSVVGVGFVLAAVAVVVAGVFGIAFATLAIWLGSKFPLICPSWASWFHRSNGSIFSSFGVGIKGGGVNGLGMGTGVGAGVLEGIF